MELAALCVVITPVTLGVLVAWTNLGNKPGWRLAASASYGLLSLILLIGILTHSFNIYPIILLTICLFATFSEFGKYRALRNPQPEPKIRSGGGITTPEMLGDYPNNKDDIGI